MANRRFVSQFRNSFQKDPTDVFAHITFGASGAPTLDNANSFGVFSVTRNSTGNYTFVFGSAGSNIQALDSYNYLLMVKHMFINSTAPAAPGMYVTNNSVNVPGVASITVQFNSAGTATDPGNGEQVLIDFIMRNSSVR
jgi:hypothetical protein